VARHLTLGGDVAGRSAVVTGAAHGIGLAIARHLHALEARVVAIDVDAVRLRQTATEWEGIVGDLSGETTKLANVILDRYGVIELLVNNVGVASEKRFRDLTEADLDRTLATNLRGPMFLTRRLVEALIDTERPGAVVFVSSLHDHFVRLVPDYSVSKAAVSMLVRELAYELAPHRSASTPSRQVRSTPTRIGRPSSLTSRTSRWVASARRRTSHPSLRPC
jgi:glucose 1-dehydrogenase